MSPSFDVSRGLGPGTPNRPREASGWTWRFEDASGDPMEAEDAPSAAFASQADAESWIGEVWQDLADQGVAQVRLFHGEQEVYGPMSLSAE